MAELARCEREYLKEMTESPDIEGLWLQHCRTMKDYGFDRLLYGFTRFRTAQSLGDPNDFVLLSNHAQEYLNTFINSGMYLTAPMVNWALENEGACSWSVITDMINQGGLTDGEKRVLAFNTKHNVVAGYTISFKSISTRSKAAIALTAAPGLSQEDVDAIWAKHGPLITLMNNIVHLKVLTLPHVPPHQSLTKRQREALEWVGDGKTMQDIATIMGLTQATIEKHLRLAREALNVDTTAQAVLKASFQNQMFILDSPNFNNG